MKKIESLTDAQISKFPQYVKKWLDIGLSCEPCDLEKAKKAAVSAYKAAGLEPPKLWFVFDSPLSAAVGATMLKAQVWDQVRAQVRDQFRAQVFGSHEAAWLAMYDFIMRELNLSCVLPLNGLMELAKHCGWWSPYAGACVLQHRHSEVHFDEEKRLHNDTGMAVKYRDGFGVWSINGIRVDEQIVMHPESQTIAQIHGEQNQDIRSIRIDRFGWPRYLKESGADCVDFRDNAIEGTKEALYATNEGDKRLVATCATGRVFAMGVPSEVRTCEAAQEWLAGGKKFRLVART
jgi:hypothetical protein